MIRFEILLHCIMPADTPPSPPPFSHAYPFDPAYGLDLQGLLNIVPPEAPADFAAFWARRYAAAMALDPRPRLLDTGQILGRHAVHELVYHSTGGVEIRGWLLLPLAGRPARGVLVGHGYGGRTGPDEAVDLDDAAVLFPCFRGMGCSPLAGVSEQPLFHVLHDIRHRDRYILGGCVEDLWLGVSALLDLCPEVADRVACQGVSFGGGIAAMAAPWDPRINRLYLRVPSFGHQALRLTLPCVGSGEAVRIFQRHHGDIHVMETLAYYDAAVAARFMDIPTLVAAALFDPAVPPPGQFAIFNALPVHLRRLFPLPAGHFGYPGEGVREEALRREAAGFLAES